MGFLTPQKKLFGALVLLAVLIVFILGEFGVSLTTEYENFMTTDKCSENWVGWVRRLSEGAEPLDIPDLPTDLLVSGESWIVEESDLEESVSFSRGTLIMEDSTARVGPLVVSRQLCLPQAGLLHVQVHIKLAKSGVRVCDGGTCFASKSLRDHAYVGVRLLTDKVSTL
jgi:hypothetical protein